LRKSGYKILERNYRQKWGEIDIIARSPENVLVFVEVKTVSGPGPRTTPEDQMTKAKLEKLRRTANVYANAQSGKLTKNGWRIDLLAIVVDGDNAEVKHYENV